MIARFGWPALLIFCTLVNAVYGGVYAQKPESKVNADHSKNTNNQASSESGVVEDDVEMTGSAVINGEVWIDGIKVDRPQSVFVSKKSGKTYRIRWGKNSNVSVTEE